MASSAEERFLRQLSASNGGDEGVCGGQQVDHKEYCAERRGSRRWSRKRAAAARGYCGAGGGYDDYDVKQQAEATSAAARGYCGAGGGYDDYDVKQQAEATSAAARKRVIVVVDDTSGSKHAMMWALTHVASKGDFLTLLHVLLPHSASGGGCSRGEEASSLANSLGTLCKASRPEVEVEALVIQGPKLGTVLSQVKKLEASVLVLGQGRPSPCYRWLSCFLRSSSEEFVEQCIEQAECLTLAVRKQSKAVGGYLVSTRWQKNFWLLA